MIEKTGRVHSAVAKLQIIAFHLLAGYKQFMKEKEIMFFGLLEVNSEGVPESEITGIQDGD